MLLLQVTLVLYFIGTVLFLVYLVNRSEVVSKVAVGIAGLGFVTHTGGLAMQLFSVNQMQWVTFHKAMSFFSWSLVLVYMTVALRQKLYTIGSFIFPLAFLALLSTAILPAETPALNPMFHAVWIHVTLSMLGTVGFVSDLEPRLYTFWRSRPISSSGWFWLRYVAGLFAIALFFVLPIMVVAAVTTEGQAVGFLLLLPLLSLVVYSLGVFCACTEIGRASGRERV